MTQENFNKMVADFFEALRKKTHNIGNKLRGKGVKLPTDFYNNIQYQHCI